MLIVNSLASALLIVGQLWVAWMLWNHDDLLWAVLVLLVPIPLIGLFAWYRSGWDSTFRARAIIYLSGYALTILLGMS